MSISIEIIILLPEAVKLLVNWVKESIEFILFDPEKIFASSFASSDIITL